MRHRRLLAQAVVQVRRRSLKSVSSPPRLRRLLPEQRLLLRPKVRSLRLAFPRRRRRVKGVCSLGWSNWTIPSNAQVVGAPAFDGTKAPDLLQSLDRALPGVALSDQTGNQFQLDLNYRGFIASPVIGTPQGLAVYQNEVASMKSSAILSTGISSRRKLSTN